MKREKFIRKQAKRLGITEERLLQGYEIVRCECGEPGCPGWRAVLMTPERRRATT